MMNELENRLDLVRGTTRALYFRALEPTRALCLTTRALCLTFPVVAHKIDVYIKYTEGRRIHKFSQLIFVYTLSIVYTV